MQRICLTTSTQSTQTIVARFSTHFLNLPVLDLLDQHFQASLHFPLTNDVSNSQRHPNELSGILRIESGAAGSSHPCGLNVFFILLFIFYYFE